MSSVQARPEANDRLKRFVLVDIAACASGVIAVLSVHIFVVESGWLLVLAALVGATGAVLAASLITLRRGFTELTVAIIAAANWAVSPTVVAIATFAMPVLIMASLLPAVLAIAYVPRTRHRAYVIASVITSVSVVALALLQDFSHLTRDLPLWVTELVPIAATPLMSGIIAFIALQNAHILERSLDAALVANKALDESREAIAHQAEALRASRARVVAAGDRERRRIERDLHDGAQQHLIGISLHIADLREHTTDSGLKVALDETRLRVRAAASELRDLAHGVYPAVLAAHGLAAALDSALEKCPMKVRASLATHARFPSDVEEAVYFTCLEAIQNAIKHAGRSAQLIVSLASDDQVLRFEVTDDGDGFDIERVAGVGGLQNMADRIGAVGGSLAVRSSMGAGGTSIIGSIPAEAADRGMVIECTSPKPHSDPSVSPLHS